MLTMEPLRNQRPALPARRAPPVRVTKSTRSIKSPAKRRKARSMRRVKRRGGGIERKENGREQTRNGIRLRVDPLLPRIVGPKGVELEFLGQGLVRGTAKKLPSARGPDQKTENLAPPVEGSQFLFCRAIYDYPYEWILI